MERPLTLVALVFTGMLASPSAPAEEGRGLTAAELGWTCALCPDSSGWTTEAWLGFGFGGGEFRFGDYNGYDNRSAFLFGVFDGRYRDKAADYLEYEGYLLDRDALALFVEGGRQSLYELRGSYQAIPRRFFDTTVTPYSGSGTSRLVLPADWVRAPTTDQMTAFPATARPIEIGWDWSIYGVGFDLKPKQGWTISADLTRREREGVRRGSGAFFFSGVEFGAPVNYTTDELDVAMSYTADRWQARVSYYGSTFDNRYSDLTFDNPFTSAVGADTGQLALEPANQSHQVSIDGAITLPARTNLTGQVSVGRLTQDEALLPYTTNAGLPVSPLPAATARAEADTLNLNLRAVSSPWQKLTVEGELRYNDFNNNTPINAYEYVVTDSFPAAGSVLNTAYSYTRRDIGLRSEYRLNRRTFLQLGIDNDRFIRTQQARHRTTTNRLWFKARTRFGDGGRVDFELFTDDRDGSEYQTPDNPAAPENPLMRKYNQADRRRDGFRVRGGGMLGVNGDFDWEVGLGRDKYGDSQIGITASDYLRWGLDISYLFGGVVTGYGSFYSEDVETDQRNSQSFGDPDWSATTNDRFNTLTLGAEWPEAVGKLTARVNYILADSAGRIENDTNGLPSAFPTLRSRRQNINLALSYPWRPSIDLSLEYLYERYESDDWALDNVGPQTVPNFLALGAAPWNYGVGMVYLNVRYKTGQ